MLEEFSVSRDPRSLFLGWSVPGSPTDWMRLFCLQLDASCLQLSFFTYSCVLELSYVQFELFCLQLKILYLQLKLLYLQ